jgi:ABC-type uncharacterized transport system permease subunit
VLGQFSVLRPGYVFLIRPRWDHSRMEPQSSRRDDDAMSRPAVPVGRRKWATFVPAERPRSANFNVGLLAALVACVAIWVIFALTVYSLI